MTNETRDTRVDELRQQLRALGYLDAGVDRFVLAPARGERGPIGVAAGASVRVSLLAAALLGPAAAVGVAGWLPELVSGIRDALVLALYLSILFFIATAVLTFAATAATAVLVRPGPGFARRAKRITSAAAWAATLGCLAYLTFWWRTAGFGWTAPLRTTIALIVAVLISLLLGHAVRIATLGVAATRDEGRGELPPLSRRSWHVVVAGGALAFAGAAILLVAMTAASTEARTIPELSVISKDLRVRVIAIDGVDPGLFDRSAWPGPLTGKSTGPGAILAERYELRPQDTSDPARAWTTIATGEPPEVHGVRAIETRHVAGIRGILGTASTRVGKAVRAATDMVRLTRPSIASGNERKSMTVWEVADRAGLRTSVINWWATWPAASRTAIVLTDRAVLRLELGGPLDGEIAPADLYPSLQAQWPSIRARARSAAGSVVAGLTDQESSAILHRSAELDATVIGLENALAGPPRDLDVVYLPGLDIAQHALLGSENGTAAAPSLISARITALRRYQLFLRTALDPWLHPGPGEVVLLLTQPGRIASPARGTMTVFGVLKPPQHVDGGPGGPPRVYDRGEADVTDVAPTILGTLGLPLSEELRGKPRAGVFSWQYPDHVVTTYGLPFRVGTARTGKPLDQEMIDRLRSLGYVR